MSHCGPFPSSVLSAADAGVWVAEAAGSGAGFAVGCGADCHGRSSLTV